MNKGPENSHQAPADSQTSVAIVAYMQALAVTMTQMQAGSRISINEALVAAFQAASSPHTLRALQSDLDAFDTWCRAKRHIALPASPETVAAYLDARAGKKSKPASLARYKTSIVKIHHLLDLKDPTQAQLVKLRLRGIRCEKGSRRRRGPCGSSARSRTSSATRRAGLTFGLCWRLAVTI